MIKNASFIGLSVLAAVGLLAAPVLAEPKAAGGKCVLKTTRTACPKKEKESYTLCKGAQSCEEIVAAATADDCAAAAAKSCSITRPQITKSKTVTATFGGKPVEGGKNFCAAEPPTSC